MKNVKWIAALVIASLLGTSAWASAPACYTYSGTGYCQYTGRVSQAYVNSNGEIILYFDAPMASTAPSSVGITGVSVFGAALFRLSDNPDYGKMLYASMLSAQARGANVQVQLWGVIGGYMKIDRIWVQESSSQVRVSGRRRPDAHSPGPCYPCSASISARAANGFRSFAPLMK